MAIVHDRHSPVRLFGRRILIVGLLALALAAIFGVWNAYRKERESRGLRVEAQGQLADLSARETQLNADIAKLESARGKEEALRQQYTLAGKGESLIIIVDPSEQKPAHATSTLLQWLQRTLWPW